MCQPRDLAFDSKKELEAAMRWAAGGYVRLRQRAVRGDDARCVELFAYQKHSLNGSEDNSVAEVVRPMVA